MAVRLGVDVGGTFSDLIVYDADSNRVLSGKVLSTPAAPERGVLDVVKRTALPDQLARAEFFLHGTTVGLNALLERRGPVLAMLTTRGFRDVLELRRADRLATYDPVWKASAPLIPRSLRLPVTERVRADGTVETALVADDVRAVYEVLVAADVESVAVAFINAYANPAHELQARDLLIEAGFTGDISLSHAISGEFREYERTSTTVIDAYVRPRVVHYLSSLEDRLREEGFAGTGLVTRCGGGSLTFAEAERRPFETIMSGPVAGAVGAGALCRQLGISMAITADVGGTSFDTALIVDGHPHLRHEGEIAGMPVQTPWVDVRSIGAGGGSIAYADAGLLRVGPRSAGASPGPACYGLGGTEPTVTDAAVCLGLIPPGHLSGGIALDVEAAQRAVGALASNLSLAPLDAARGVLRVVAATMADAIRSVSLAQGHDPRGATLIPYGGAGPLFSTLLADELSIDRVIVPHFPGNFSAWGLLNQDLAQSAATTTVRPLDEQGVDAANSLLAELLAVLRRRSDPRLDALDGVDQAELDLRYTGQEHSLTIAVEVNASTGAITSTPGAIGDAFETTYRRTFGHALADAIEIVTVRATRRRLLPPVEGVAGTGQTDGGQASATREAFSFAADELVAVTVHQRSAIQAGDVLEGPLIVMEPSATTYMDAGFSMSPNVDGLLVIERTQVAP
jgi:N-methylhydantoinase A